MVTSGGALRPRAQRYPVKVRQGPGGVQQRASANKGPGAEGVKQRGNTNKGPGDRGQGLVRRYAAGFD